MFLTIIYTNYFVIIFISRQTILIIINIDKFNFRLMRILQYFFNFNLLICYKFEKFNIVSNVLSQLLNALQLNVKNKIEILNTLYNYSIDFSNNKLRFVILQNMSTITYYIILIKMFDEFKQCFKAIYFNNTH